MKLPKFEKVKSMAASAGRFFCYDVNIYDEKINHAHVLLLLIGCDLVGCFASFLAATMCALLVHMGACKCLCACIHS